MLQKALQEYIARGLNDPRVGGLVTVTAVRVSEDLKNADVMVSVLPEEKEELSLHGLRHASTYIRRKVGDMVALRQLPQLHFKLDRSLKKQAEVLAALAKAAETTPPAAGGGGGEKGQRSSEDSDAAAGDAGNNPGGTSAAWPPARRGPVSEESAGEGPGAGSQEESQ